MSTPNLFLELHLRTHNKVGNTNNFRFSDFDLVASKALQQPFSILPGSMQWTCQVHSGTLWTSVSGSRGLLDGIGQKRFLHPRPAPTFAVALGRGKTTWHRRAGASASPNSSGCVCPKCPLEGGFRGSPERLRWKRQAATSLSLVPLSEHQIKIHPTETGIHSGSLNEALGECILSLRVNAVSGGVWWVQRNVFQKAVLRE